MFNNRPNKAQKGRGAVSNLKNRLDNEERVPEDDGWWNLEDDLLAKFETQLRPDTSKTIISHNTSPDIPFDRSINPYKGCEHGCIYCYARPTHSYLGMSPGLDFETKIFFKENAAVLLERELRRQGYECKPIALGVNTDAYQPAEKELKITRSILEVLSAYNHPVSIITKSSRILNDLDFGLARLMRFLKHKSEKNIAGWPLRCKSTQSDCCGISLSKGERNCNMASCMNS